jgi:hypothetical protein
MQEVLKMAIDSQKGVYAQIKGKFLKTKYLKYFSLSK